MIDATLNLFREMMRKDPTPSVRQAGEDAVRLSRAELEQLRANLARVTKERDEAQAALKRFHERIAAEAGVELAALTAARAETARLRERVQSVADKLCELAVEYRRNPQVHSTYSECASRIHAALTSDPEPTT